MIKFTNNASSALNAAVSATDTGITVASGTGVLFPTLEAGDYFIATLVDTEGNFEIIKVIERDADLFTIVRAQEGTTARNFESGNKIELRLTAGSIEQALQPFVGPTASAAGSAGSVPAPAAGAQNSILFSDGTWKDALNYIYPVGSIYMSTVAASPETIWGGTWVALNEGRVLIGANTAYAAGSTGGEFSHALSVAELAAHSHTGITGAAGNHTHDRGSMEITGSFGNFSCRALYLNGAFGNNGTTGGGEGNGNYTEASVNFYASRTWTGVVSYPGDHQHFVGTYNTGNGTAHNNMQPYLSVYMWKRTA